MRITSPIEADGVMILALRIGSETVSSTEGSGICSGLSRSFSSPFLNFSL